MTERPTLLTHAVAISLWRTAAAEEVGVRIPIAQADIEKVKKIFYDSRKTVIDQEPELGSLMLCVAPGAEEVWLVKRTVEAP